MGGISRAYSHRLDGPKQSAWLLTAKAEGRGSWWPSEQVLMGGPGPRSASPGPQPVTERRSATEHPLDAATTSISSSGPSGAGIGVCRFSREVSSPASPLVVLVMPVQNWRVGRPLSASIQTWPIVPSERRAVPFRSSKAWPTGTAVTLRMSTALRSSCWTPKAAPVKQTVFRTAPDGLDSPATRLPRRPHAVVVLPEDLHRWARKERSAGSRLFTSSP